MSLVKDRGAGLLREGFFEPGAQGHDALEHLRDVLHDLAEQHGVEALFCIYCGGLVVGDGSLEEIEEEAPPGMRRRKRTGGEPPVLTITVTRQESYDPLSIIEQATRQAVAQQIAYEHASSGDPEALTWRYEKDSNSAGDYVDLVITGTDEARVSLVLRRLRAHGYDDLGVEWLADEDPPHLVEVISAGAGLPASPSRAREALEELGFYVALIPDTEEGFYKTSIPATFPARSVAKLADSEWIVRVVHRG